MGIALTARGQANRSGGLLASDRLRGQLARRPLGVVVQLSQTHLELTPVSVDLPAHRDELATQVGAARGRRPGGLATMGGRTFGGTLSEVSAHSLGAPLRGPFPGNRPGVGVTELWMPPG